MSLGLVRVRQGWLTSPRWYDLILPGLESSIVKSFRQSESVWPSITLLLSWPSAVPTSTLFLWWPTVWRQSLPTRQYWFLDSVWLRPSFFFSPRCFSFMHWDLGMTHKTPIPVANDFCHENLMAKVLTVVHASPAPLWTSLSAPDEGWLIGWMVRLIRNDHHIRIGLSDRAR